MMLVTAFHLQHDATSNSFYLTSGDHEGRSHTTKVSQRVAVRLLQSYSDALDQLEPFAADFTPDDREQAA